MDQDTFSVNLNINGKSHTLRCSAVLGPTKLDLLTNQVNR